MNKIPLIKADLPSIDEVSAEFAEILANGRITNFGRHVDGFEREAAEYLGVPTVTTSSATAALIMTLQALDLPEGSRVAIPSFSFVATAQAVRYAGCVPTFVEIREDGNISPDDLRHVLNQHHDVSAVIGVHMYGLPCDVDAIDEVVREASARSGRLIRTIYDAAHAFGAVRLGTRVGNFGDAEVFSLSVTKILTSVEGGMVASANLALLDRLRRMRNYGIHANYNARYPGLNGKMSEFHAIVGRHNLRRLPALMAARTERSRRYADAIHRRTSCKVMLAPAGVVSTYKDFTILLPPGLKVMRDTIMERLLAHGVETRAYFYPPIHEQEFFRPYANRLLPTTEDLARRVITLPFFTSISDAEIEQVTDALGASIDALTPAATAQEAR